MTANCWPKRCPTWPNVRLGDVLSRHLRRDYQQEGCNLMAAVEATVRCVKHPFPASKLPVRGKFRMACMPVPPALCVDRFRRHDQCKAYPALPGSQNPGRKATKCRHKRGRSHPGSACCFYFCLRQSRPDRFPLAGATFKVVSGLVKSKFLQ